LPKPICAVAVSEAVSPVSSVTVRVTVYLSATV